MLVLILTKVELIEDYLVTDYCIMMAIGGQYSENLTYADSWLRTIFYIIVDCLCLQLTEPGSL